MNWSYGVTTVQARFHSLLPRTLRSLAEGGFSTPRLFVDGAVDGLQWSGPLTVRQPAVRTVGNWILALWELYLREPNADRYALFQDDLITCRNLRKYLEQCTYPSQGFWNLYTIPPPRQIELPAKTGWYPSNQMGRGAVALVFNREAVVTLLGSPLLIAKPQDCHRGWKGIDGAVMDSFKKLGWMEYIHQPSLVQHTGLFSSMRSKPQWLSESFRGEQFNALELLS